MNKKGYVYTLEVLIAASMITMALVFMFKTPPAKPETELSMIKKQGFESLQYLDNSGELRPLVFQNNETQIQSLLKNLTTAEFEVHICKNGDICSVSSDLVSNVPGNQTVVVVDYYISGYKHSYSPKKVKLFLWRKY
jgi:hypothetical protein